MIRGIKRIEIGWPKILSNGGYERHSNPTKSYNCIAYAAGDLFAWWEPNEYWPHGAPKGYKIHFLAAAYQAVGFTACGSDCSPEPGFEKVALFQDANGNWTHAARLRPDGWWESKLGELDDVIHGSPACLEGKTYGTVALFMKRSVTESLRARIECRRRARGTGRW